MKQIGRGILCSDRDYVKQILLGCLLENGERYFEMYLL